MPYSGPGDKSLPSNVLALSSDERARWVNIWNSAFRRCEEKNTGDCEAVAFRAANGVLFEGMALFTPPVEMGREGALSARGVRQLAETGNRWAQKIAAKLDRWSEVKMLTEVTKTVSGKARSAGDFLVVEDPEKTSTWHLPVKVNGKPDRRLMGAAKAALTSAGGYRGQRYAGPDKAKATAKLKAMYKAEDMPWTTASEGAPVSEMFGDGMMPPVIFGGPTTFADLQAAEEASEAADHVRTLTYQFQSLVVNIMTGDDDDKVAAVETLAAEFVALIRETLDEAVTEAVNLGESSDLHADGAAVEVARDATEADLSEAGVQAAENGRRAPVVVKFRILNPGPGNKRDGHYYPASVLERDIHVFGGVDVFATDHKEPERSERTKVGRVLECPNGFMENGAPTADVIIYDPYQAEKVRNRNDAGELATLECSIFGNGRAKKGEIDGHEYKVVEALTKGIFVELVSKAGAGGQALQLSEGAMENEKDEKDENAELEEVTIEEDAAQAPPSQDDDSQETDPAETEPKPVTMLEADAVTATLAESNLPTAFKAALSVAEYADDEALQGAIAEAVAEVKALTGSGQPFAQGVSETIEATRLSEVEIEKRHTEGYDKIMRSVGL
ncbi:MAG: hypothetical protein GY832_26355 [Chloroflexi bacterium]|nr:hypothetical protein [Chloroflexota bacterium]